MEFSHFIEWGFYGVISGGVIYGVSILAALKASIDSLNASMSALVEKSEWIEKTLDRHESKLSDLEVKVLVLNTKEK